jgi:hypothetical protein
MEENVNLDAFWRILYTARFQMYWNSKIQENLVISKFTEHFLPCVKLCLHTKLNPSRYLCNTPVNYRYWSISVIINLCGVKQHTLPHFTEFLMPSGGSYIRLDFRCTEIVKYRRISLSRSSQNRCNISEVIRNSTKGEVRD